MPQRELRLTAKKDHFGQPIDNTIPYRTTSFFEGRRPEIFVVPYDIIEYKGKDLVTVWVEDLEDWHTGEKMTFDKLDMPEKNNSATSTSLSSKPKIKEPKSTIVPVTVNGVEHDFYVIERSKMLYEVKCDSLDNIEATVEYKGKKETVKGKGAKKHRTLILQAVERVK